MTKSPFLASVLLTAMYWTSVAPNPMRQRIKPAPEVGNTENWDYQADVYDNRILDDVNNQKASSKLMRPSPSNSLPTLTLQLPSSTRDRLPTTKDLDERYLLKLIGTPLDERYVSVTQPVNSILFPNGTMDTNFKKGLPKDELPDEIQHLHFKAPGGGDKNTDMRIKSPKYRRMLRQYLWAHSYCPVLYKWKDLGERFWPRWINEGDCYKGRSCSIPAGMMCKPSESEYFTVLWWHCRTKSRCKWIPFKYPIITKCTCGC